MPSADVEKAKNKCLLKERLSQPERPSEESDSI